MELTFFDTKEVPRGRGLDHFLAPRFRLEREERERGEMRREMKEMSAEKRQDKGKRRENRG